MSTKNYSQEIIEAINSLYKLVSELRRDINNLKNEYIELSNVLYNNSYAKSENNKPLFHSLDREEKLKLGEKRNINLDETADLLILDYKRNPPKRQFRWV